MNGVLQPMLLNFLLDIFFCGFNRFFHKSETALFSVEKALFGVETALFFLKVFSQNLHHLIRN